MIRAIGIGLVAAFVIGGGWTARAADDDSDRVSTRLQPRQEVPAVSSPAARGTLVALIDDEAQKITYTLTYSGLQANITQSHIHIAQRSVNGAIVIWLCGTGAAGTPLAGPAGTPTCPGARSGEVSRTVGAADVQTVPTQGIVDDPASDVDKFERVAAAIRRGLAYANVHTAQSPGGEMRGQIRADDDDDDDNDSDR